MTNYQIRTYTDEDFEQVLDLLNRNKEYDSITEEILNEKLEGDPSWDASKTFLCAQDKKVVGFMQGVMREPDGTRYGYIKLMAVEATHRRQGIAAALLQHLEQRFKFDHVEKLRIYDVPQNYFMPGIDPRYTEAVCFALRQGFNRFADTANMIVDLSGNNWDTGEVEESLHSKNISIRRAEVADKNALVKFVENQWPLWRNELLVAMKDVPPSVHIATRDGDIKAFAGHNGNNKGTGWFGPMGTHPGLRGLGVGAILLKRCLLDIKMAGLKQAIIPWVGPIDFYAHHAHARVERVFWRFEKQLAG